MPLLDLRFGDLYTPQEFARTTEALTRISEQYTKLPEEEAVYQLWDFVCRQIKYPDTDSDRHIMSAYQTSNRAFFGPGYEIKEVSDDFWQFPNETLAWGIGDCADTSNLLCGIATNFVSPDRMYVVVGEVINGVGHAWVEYFPPQDSYIYKGKGKILETTLKQAPSQTVKGIRTIVNRGYHEYDEYWRYNSEVLEGEPVMPNKTSSAVRQKAIQQLWGVPVKGT